MGLHHSSRPPQGFNLSRRFEGRFARCDGDPFAVPPYSGERQLLVSCRTRNFLKRMIPSNERQEVIDFHRQKRCRGPGRTHQRIRIHIHICGYGR